MADPMALVVADAAAHAVEFVGLPEAQLNLAQAVVHLATAPKSNRAALGIWTAREDVRHGPSRRGAAPPARRPLPGRRRSSGTARATTILTTDPEGLGRPAVPPRRARATARYYEPSAHGFEQEIARAWHDGRRRLRVSRAPWRLAALHRRHRQRRARSVLLAVALVSITRDAPRSVRGAAVELLRTETLPVDRRARRTVRRGQRRARPGRRAARHGRVDQRHGRLGVAASPTSPSPTRSSRRSPSPAAPAGRRARLREPRRPVADVPAAVLAVHRRRLRLRRLVLAHALRPRDGGSLRARAGVGRPRRRHAAASAPTSAPRWPRAARRCASARPSSAARAPTAPRLNGARAIRVPAGRLGCRHERHRSCAAPGTSSSPSASTRSCRRPSLIPTHPTAPDVHQLGDDAVRPVLPRRGAGALRPAAGGRRPEVRAGRRQAQRPRRHRPHAAPPQLLRDARQLELRRLLQGRGHHLGLGAAHRGARPRRRPHVGHRPRQRRRGRGHLGRRGRASPPSASSGSTRTTSGRWATPARAGRARRSSGTTAPTSAPTAARPTRRPRTATSRSGTSCSCSTSGARRRPHRPAHAENVDTGAGLERMLTRPQRHAHGVRHRRPRPPRRARPSRSPAAASAPTTAPTSPSRSSPTTPAR